MIDLSDNYRQSQYSIQMYTVSTVSIEFVPDEFSSAQPELVANSIPFVDAGVSMFRTFLDHRLFHQWRCPKWRSFSIAGLIRV